jgi:hypothetical protein
MIQRRSVGEEFSEMQRFLWRFRMVASEAHVMLRGFDQTGDVAKNVNEDLLFSLCNHALIIVCKFLEVWDEFGSLAKDSERTRNLRSAIQCYVDRIRIWKGLEQFRNTALAHPYLTKDKKLIGPWELIANEKAPSYHAESVLLLQIVSFAVLCILSGYPEEYREIKPTLAAPAPLTTAGPGITRGTEINPVLSHLAGIAETKMTALGVTIPDDIAAEFISGVGH